MDVDRVEVEGADVDVDESPSGLELTMSVVEAMVVPVGLVLVVVEAVELVAEASVA